MRIVGGSWLAGVTSRRTSGSPAAVASAPFPLCEGLETRVLLSETSPVGMATPPAGADVPAGLIMVPRHGRMVSETYGGAFNLVQPGRPAQRQGVTLKFTDWSVDRVAGTVTVAGLGTHTFTGTANGRRFRLELGGREGDADDGFTGTLVGSIGNRGTRIQGRLRDAADGTRGRFSVRAGAEPYSRESMLNAQARRARPQAQPGSGTGGTGAGAGTGTGAGGAGMPSDDGNDTDPAPHDTGTGATPGDGGTDPTQVGAPDQAGGAPPGGGPGVNGPPIPGGGAPGPGRGPIPGGGRNPDGSVQPPPPGGGPNVGGPPIPGGGPGNGPLPIPGGGPGRSPIPGGGAGGTPIPGGGPGSSPIPGGGAGGTPIPGGGPGSTPIPGGGAGATPIPGGGPGAGGRPIPGGGPG